MAEHCDHCQADNEQLRLLLRQMLDEFSASLNSGKAVGSTAGSMQRALRMIHRAEAALRH